MSDRRHGLRVTLPRLVRGFVDDRPIWGLGHDVSPTGMRLTVAAPLGLQAGRGLALALALDDDTAPLWIYARVCAARSPGAWVHSLGVRFARLAEAERLMLARYCVAQRQRDLVGLVTRVRPVATT